MKDTIKRLRELEAAATPGEWCATVGASFSGKYEQILSPDNDDGYFRTEDAQLIAEMRNHLIPLLDRLDKVEKLIDTINWCDENDEPVSGYIMDALAALEESK